MNSEIKLYHNKRKGFIAKSIKTQQYYVDWRENTSVIANDILLRSLLEAQAQMRGRLLDVGCGRRPYGIIYDSLVDSSVSTEVAFSPHGLNEANVISYAEQLPFANATFDTVLCTEVLEHTQQPFSALKEFARVLRPGGHLILSVPFMYPLHEPPHDYWRFTNFGLQQICQSTGLKVVKISNKHGVFAYLAVLCVIFSSRAVNLISKLSYQSTPLRDREWVSWLLTMPQYGYLWCVNKLARLGFKDDSPWMPIGYLVIAQKLEDREQCL